MLRGKNYRSLYFRPMTSTLNLYTDYLISSAGQTSATGMSRLIAGEVSHDQVTRWLSTYLVNSDTSLNQAQGTTIYQRRWKV